MPSSPVPALVRVLQGEKLDRPPVWFMRQAGRCLPEYLALRSRAKDFISFCLDAEAATEVTLQPVRRFPYDAAIVFADILLIPMALGQRVWFEAGEGPRLGPLPEIAALRARVPETNHHLAAVGETVRGARAALEPERALIGFCGGPWTVATYMIQGRGGDREEARAYAYNHPAELEALIDVLVDASVDYLEMQVKAGAQVLQIFESWAENLAEDVFARLVTAPHRRIVERLRARGVTVPFIGFPRGAGALVEPYAEGAPVQAVGLDTQASAAIGRRLQASHAIQGALDPLMLRAGGEALDRRIDELIDQWSGGRHVFNLGHGVIPDTPMAHIEQALKRITGR